MRRRSDKTKDKDKEKASEKKYEKVRHSHRNIRKRRKSSSSSDDSSAEESKINTRRSRSREKGLVKKIEKSRTSVGSVRSSRSDSENEATTSRPHKSSKKQETDASVKVAPKKDNAGGDEEWKEDKSFWEGEDVKSDTTDQKHKDKESKSSVWQVKTSDTDGDSNKLKLCIVRPSEPSSQRSPRRSRRSSGHHHSHKEENEMDTQEKKKLCESPDEKRKTRKASKEESKNVDSAEETVSVVKEEIKYDIIPHSLDDIQLPDNMPSEVITFKSPVSEKVEPCDTETCVPKDDEKTEPQPDDVVSENLKETVSDEKIDNSDSNVEKKETELKKPDSDNCKELDKTEDIKERLEPLPTNESSETDAKEESSGDKTNRRDSSDRTSNERNSEEMLNERKSEERHFSSENSSPERKRKSRDMSEDKSDARDSSEDRDTSEERKGPRSSIYRPEPSSTPNNEERGRSRSRSKSSSPEIIKRTHSRSSSPEKVNDEESRDTISVPKNQGKHQRIKLKRDREVSFDRRFSAGDADKIESLTADSKKDRKSVDGESESESKIHDDSLSASDSALDSKKAAIRRKLSRALSSVNSRPVINRSQSKQLDESNAESCNASEKSLSPQRIIEKSKSRDSSPPIRREKISLKRPSSKIETPSVENEKNDTEHDDKDEKENYVNQDLEEGEIPNEPTPTVVRKRKWFSRKPYRGKNISISSDSLKDLIPDAKYLPENEVELIDEEEKEDNSKIMLLEEKKVKKRDKEDGLLRREVINVEKENVENVVRRKVVALSDENKGRVLTRKISIVSDDARNLQRSPTPPRHKVSNILYVTNLVRPFTVNQLRELLARTGNIVDGGFWIDKIKSKCYVQYENEIQAKETRHALHGVTWPVSNPKQLCVDFGSKEDMEIAKKADSEEELPKKSSPVKIEAPPQKWPSDRDKDKERERLREQIKEKLMKHKEKMMAQSRQPPEVERIKHPKSMAPMREWDVGKSENELPEERSVKHDDRNKERERERKLKKEKIRRSRSSTPEAPVRKSKKKEEEAPAKLLDDLFRKTKVTPCIYWLPLNPEQIAEKEEMRRRHMAEHERRLAEINKAEKERERRRIQLREQRRRAMADRDRRKRRSSSRSPKK